VFNDSLLLRSLTRMKVERKKIRLVESRWLVCNSFDRKEVTEWLNFDFTRVRESVTWTHTRAGTFSKYHRKPEQPVGALTSYAHQYAPVHQNLYSWPVNQSSRHVPWVIARIHYAWDLQMCPIIKFTRSGYILDSFAASILNLMLQ